MVAVRYFFPKRRKFLRLAVFFLFLFSGCVSHQLTTKASLPSKSVSDYLEKKAISKTYDDDDFTLARSSIIELTEKNNALESSLSACLANKVNNNNRIGIAITLKQALGHLVILAILAFVFFIIYWIRQKLQRIKRE